MGAILTVALAFVLIAGGLSLLVLGVSAWKGRRIDTGKHPAAAPKDKARRRLEEATRVPSAGEVAEVVDGPPSAPRRRRR